MGAETRPAQVDIRFDPVPPRGEVDPLLAAANRGASWFVVLTETESKADVGTWGLWNPIHLLSEDAIRALSLEQDKLDMPAVEFMGRLREQVAILIPGMPAEVIARLSHAQKLAIFQKCWERPPSESGPANPTPSGPASPGTSPAPPTSSGGATPT